MKFYISPTKGFSQILNLPPLLINIISLTFSYSVPFFSLPSFWAMKSATEAAIMFPERRERWYYEDYSNELNNFFHPLTLANSHTALDVVHKEMNGI